MTNQKSSGKLFLIGLILIVLFYGLIKIVGTAGGNYFILELVGTLFLLLISSGGLIFYSTKGDKILYFVFLFYIINLMLIWNFTKVLYLGLLILSTIGFVLSIPKKECTCCCRSRKEVEVYDGPHSEVFDSVVKETKIEVKEPKKTKKVSSAKKNTTKVTKKTTHSPGKYVASSNGSVYHEPKCAWAKKINKKRRIWFKNKEDAWEQGYKAHSCVN